METTQTIPQEETARPVKLTKREMEVLQLIVDGKRTKEAADQLCLSKRTLDYHLFNIYGKLRVHNRIQAYRVAMRSGLLPHEPFARH